MLLTLFVVVDFVRADAFTSLTPMTALPRTTNRRGGKGKYIISTKSTNPTDGNEDDNPLGESIDVRGGGFEVSDLPPSLPTWNQFRIFALPCLGLWIAQPLLSLVDTAFVGLSSAAETSAKQLAALGPATTFIDGSTYLFAFLNVATTNLYSLRELNGGSSRIKQKA